MAVIDNAYQYYLKTYAASGASRYDTHKKSQLRAVYNNIVKTNKESPLYKIRYSGDVQRFAIDIKEKTRSIQNIAASLSDTTGSMSSAFSRKIAETSDEETIKAQYVGYDQDVDPSTHYDVEVLRLATPQINRGSYLTGERAGFKPGTYSFDLNTNLSSYEFQYSVSAKDTNRSVQDKLVRLINNANVGLSASLATNDRGQAALQITSAQTGLSENERFLFEIIPAPDTGSMKAMHTLGIDQVAEMAQSSSFRLNGREHSSLSNTFTLNNMFELTLKKPGRKGQPVRIGFKGNADAIADNVESLVTAYNDIIKLGHSYKATQPSSKLLHDMESVAKLYYSELESVGLNLESDSYISVDRSLLTKSVSGEDAEENLDMLNRFKEALNKKAQAASIDPMNYVSKTLIAYKNPNGRNFATPYITSVYSGMMLDQTC